MKNFLFFLFLLTLSCQKDLKKTPYSFYYWRTHLTLDSQEKQTLQKAQGEHLYIRFFDIDKIDGRFQPVGVITKDKSFVTSKKIVPVIFITNKTWYGITNNEIQFLAENIFNLIQKKTKELNLNTTHEIQIDSDWTTQTKHDYFKFLKRLKAISKGEISCTLRLHQVKDKDKTGIPPVSKGYLMCYATASPLDEQPKNSSLDVQTLKNYLSDIEKYPLRFDVALPIYSWGIVSNHLGKKRLINALTKENLLQNKNFKPISNSEFEVLTDDFYFGIYMSKGFRIKVEEISQEDLHETLAFLNKKLPTFEIVYYHLDSQFIKNYVF
jgi:hypothetical protein